MVYLDLLISVSMVTLCGTVSNSLSISFYIKTGCRKLGTRILKLLNALDLIICVSVLITQILHVDDGGKGRSTNWARKIFDSFFFSAIGLSAFTTCLLSVTRAICLCFPFYKIRHKHVFGAFLVMVFFEVLKEALNVSKVYHEDQWLKLFIYPLICQILVVIISNVVCVWKLQKSERGERERENGINKRATVTVIILSSLFCFFNTLVVLMGLITITESGGRVDPRFMAYCVRFGIPFNSSLNPVVYFCRKAAMRQFISERFRNLRIFFDNVFGDLRDMIELICSQCFEANAGDISQE